jgi:proteasome lid subunit RPN8/RPN11
MIFIEHDAHTQIKTQAIQTFPDECCGFLFGTELADGNRIISTVREVDNAKAGDRRRRFEITGKDYMQAEQFALDSRLILLGIYHSHPLYPAIPSEHDRIAALPYFSYVILSVIQDRVDHIRSWRLTENSTFEEEIFSTEQINQSISWQQ